MSELCPKRISLPMRRTGRHKAIASAMGKTGKVDSDPSFDNREAANRLLA